MTTFLVMATILVAISVVYAFSLDIRAQILFRSVYLFYLKMENRYLRWRIDRTRREEARLRKEIEQARGQAREDVDATP